MDAKARTSITHVPDGIANGAEVRARSMANRIHLGKNNRVTGVGYFDREGREHFQKAKAVIVSGYAIETPRLLLNSACDGYEKGLANSSDTVGRYLMAQAGNVVLGRFDELVRMYKAPPAHALTEEFYETDPRNDFVRGYQLQVVRQSGPLSAAMGGLAGQRVAGGQDHHQNFADRVGQKACMGEMGEGLPEGTHGVTRATRVGGARSDREQPGR